MKAFIILIAVLAMIVGSAAVLAQAEGCPPGVGDIDCECINHGYDFGIAKYTCSDSYDVNDDSSGYLITITGDCDSADWTANPEVDGILVKGGTEYDVYNDGISGTVGCVNYANPNSENETCHGISHITFCGNENGGGCTGDCCDGNCDNNNVPVFPGVTIGLAVVGAGLGLALLRKK